MGRRTRPDGTSGPAASDPYGSDPYASGPPPSVESFFTGGPPPATGAFPSIPNPGNPQNPSERLGPPRRSGPRRTGPRFIDYPRYDRTGFTRWFPSWKLVSATFGGVLTALVAAFVVAYALTPVPDITAAALPQSSTVLFADGRPIGQFKIEQRTVVPLARVPVYVQRAVLSAEDRTFYENRGVSPTGILRAAWNNFRGGELQGGSTITQQYVKNFFTVKDRTLQRKAQEFMISLKVGQQTPKNDILADYLNKIYFGRETNGIQAAARAYFGVDVDKLTVSQGAFLAGIINGPEFYDPADGPKAAARATLRWTYVLDGMVQENWLSAPDAAKIKAAGLPKVIPPPKSAKRIGQLGYLMDIVAREVQARAGLSTDDLRKGGYTIKTTFDYALVRQGIASVNSVLGQRRTWPVGTQVGMASVDPTTGAVLAIYGGDDVRSYNAATQDQVIAGSTFKPFALIASLEGDAAHGVPPLNLRSRFSGKSPYKLLAPPHREVKNFGKGKGEQFKMIDLMTATAESVNTVYAQLNERIGAEQTKAVAIRAGLPSDTQDLDATPLNVLGSAAPHVLDMASAYGVIAAKGVRNAPFTVASISNGNGPVYAHAVKPTPVFDEGVMADTSYAMQQVIKRGTGTFAKALGRPAAGKTGTSSDNKSAWFVGFTPQVSTAVAIYNIGKDGQQQNTVVGWGKFKGTEITGGSFPVQVWTDYMKAALQGVPQQPLPAPVYGGEDVNPAPPTPSAQPSPSPSDAGQPSPSAPPTPTEQPTPTDQPFPSGQPTPSDQPSAGQSQPSNGQPGSSPTPSLKGRGGASPQSQGGSG